MADVNFELEEHHRKIVKLKIDEIIKDMLTKESYNISNEEILNKIKESRDILKKNTKDFSNLAKSNKEISSWWSSNIGVNISELSRGINTNIKKNTTLKKKVMIIYSEINKLSAYFRQSEETEYLFYYKDDNNNYYRKNILPQDIGKYYAIQKSQAKSFLSSYETEVTNAFNNIQVNNIFSEHISMFMNTLENQFAKNGYPEVQGDNGFKYEIYEYHMFKTRDNILTDSSGQVKNFETSHHSQGWFDQHGEAIYKSFFAAKHGTIRFIAGGDVGKYQIKSSSTFGVSSLEQLNVSANLLFNFCDEIVNSQQISREDIKNMVLFLNDIHLKVATNATEKVEQEIRKSITNMATSLGIKIE